MQPNATIAPHPYLLHNRIQPYEWGERGEEAFIARLLGIAAEPGQPYAELWIGAHPSAPSSVGIDGTLLPLPELIARCPEAILGPEVGRRFAGLPFLLKVLSAAEPLSIQVHPNRAQAAHLHACDPEHYPDANPKPEVAVALDGLTALVGFKPYAGIVQALARLPELAGLLEPRLAAELAAGRAAPYPAQQALVQRLYAALVECAAGDPARLCAALDRLQSRLHAATPPLDAAEALFLDLRRPYPGADVGLMTIFLLNLVRLQPGQGVYIAAGVPHAYLKGNIVECMAASDNVVRAGLTCKFVDVRALAEILTYDLGPQPLLEAAPGASETVYATPAAEFELARWELAPGAALRGATHGRVQVLLVTAGQLDLVWPGAGELALRQGEVVLMPACLGEYRLTTAEAAQVFRATVP